jgi:hypothetical protein
VEFTLRLASGKVKIVREHVARPVVHFLAGFIEDYSWQLDSLAIKSRDFR